jgi:type VI protein secretion system component Hcp
MFEHHHPEAVMSRARRILRIGALMLLAAGNAQAADYYLKIGGIDGESAERSHPKWIELIKVSWETGMARGIVGCTPGRECRGTVTGERVTITKAVDKASINFADALQRGRQFPSAVLHLVKNGAVVGIYTFQGLAVTGNRRLPQTGPPTEQITMTFQKVDWSHATRGEPLWR